MPACSAITPIPRPAAGALNTAIDIVSGIAHTPAAIGHLGEGTGRFSADPSWRNAGGVVSDALVVGSVLSATASALPSLNGSAAAASAGKAADIPIKGFHGSKGANPYHALDRAIERGVSPNAILETVKNPSVIIQQGGGRTLYLTPDAAVVLDGGGQAVTIWGGAQHTPKTLELIRAAGAAK